MIACASAAADESATPLRWPPVPTWDRRYRFAFLVIVTIGIASRLLFVARPFDHRSLAPWREADYVQLARNFEREGMNILYPRIDWRGDGPGFTEMEFPLLPWTAALLARDADGVVVALRVLSATLAIASLIVFAGLSRRVLPPSGSLFATAAFAGNPLLVVLAPAMQPEPLMLFCTVVAASLLWRWYDRPLPATLVAAAAATAAAILAKASAAYLGLVLAWAVLSTRGRAAFRDRAALAAALVALVPPLMWHLWAARFWHLYRNSLGVSNESHFLTWGMLTPPMFLIGLLKWETIAVFTPCGLLLAAVAAWSAGSRLRPALAWYAAVCVFYLATAGTSADDWAFYYHAVSVAPACLLMGGGFAVVWSRRPVLAGLLGAATIVALVGVTALSLHRRDMRPNYVAMERCAAEFKRLVPPAAGIVVSGGTMVDENGRPVAHNEPMMFAWMDRKGFTYGSQELSTDTLERIARRGGRFWVVRHDEMQEPSAKQARERYRLVAACPPDYVLYDLGSTESVRPAVDHLGN